MARGQHEVLLELVDPEGRVLTIGQLSDEGERIMSITQIERVLYAARAHTTGGRTEEPREPPTDG